MHFCEKLQNFIKKVIKCYIFIKFKPVFLYKKYVKNIKNHKKRENLKLAFFSVFFKAPR